MEKDGNVSTLESECRLREDIADSLSDDNVCLTEFNESLGERERDAKKEKTKNSKKQSKVIVEHRR